MRFAALLVVLALSLSLFLSSSSSAADAPAPAAAAPKLIPRAEIERDLNLTLRRTTTEPFELHHDPHFEVVLTNRSKTRSYPVVVSADGSEMGWREPTFFSSVERKTGAQARWTVPGESPVARCGVFAEDWTKDVVTLAPGKSVTLPWFSIDHKWNLDGATHLRIAAHYLYSDHSLDLSKVPAVLHAMPAYELVSNLLELAIEPPLALELTVNAASKMPKPGDLLSSSFSVVAVNRGKNRLPFSTAEKAANVSFELEGVEADGSKASHSISSGISVDDAVDRIAPGGRRDVLGAATMHATSSTLPVGFTPQRARARLHLWWYSGPEVPATDPDAGTFRFQPSEERFAISPWVEITNP